MKTNIFATFGPSCRDEQTIRAMISAGMTGMRLNLSHMSLPDAKEYINSYKNAAESVGVVPQILIDMQGPELRIGKADVEANDTVVFGPDGIAVPDEILSCVQIGDEILIDDGKILGLCIETGRNMKVDIIRKGYISTGKSIKIRNKDIAMPALTAQDVENISLASGYPITAVMQPFVRSADDLKYVRGVLDENGCTDIKIFAKIENMTGVQKINEIIEFSDVIVIARGDLGNDMPLWELPRIQKTIENACKAASKPYIVVTQMLASMESSPIPTRAEVSDIFHAVYNGAWGVMITGESAVGKFPIEAVNYLCNTAKEAEFYLI